MKLNVCINGAAAAALWFGLTNQGFAQANNIPGVTNVPVVSVVASDAAASETGPNPGVFTVRRSGPTNAAILVFYTLGGRASNGLDYAALPGNVSLPAGVLSAPIAVTPIDDALVEGTEGVELRLVPSLLASPLLTYVIGTPSGASLAIADNDMTTSTNQPPVVWITAPTDGAQFRAPADIQVRAVTTDADGYAPRVEFFANGVPIGAAEVVFIQPPPPGQSIALELVWSNVVAGPYTLTARATDNQGATAVSPPVHISVTASNEPPTNSSLPIVSILALDANASEGLVMWCSNRVIGVNNLAGAIGVLHTNLPCVSGTNTAVFKVERSGSLTDSLRVYYATRGTASNGVDYAPLPGVVTIPVGQRAAHLVVNPIDDALPERLETIEVQLQLPSLPLSPPDRAYQIGRRSAGAFILDNDQPAPPCRPFPDGMFHLCHPGTNGLCFRIDVTTNLVNWAAHCTNRVVDGAVHFVDPEARDCVHRFYRVIQIPCPPDAP